MNALDVEKRNNSLGYLLLLTGVFGHSLMLPTPCAAETVGSARFPVQNGQVDLLHLSAVPAASCHREMRVGWYNKYQWSVE